MSPVNQQQLQKKRKPKEPRCYLCRKGDRPLHLDEVGGTSCDECEAEKVELLYNYALAGGYYQRGKPRLDRGAFRSGLWINEGHIR